MAVTIASLGLDKLSREDAWCLSRNFGTASLRSLARAY